MLGWVRLLLPLLLLLLLLGEATITTIFRTKLYSVYWLYRKKNR